MKWKEWNFLSAVLKLVVETLNMISCTHQCLAETLLCCWERLDELSLIFIWTEVERLDCSSAVTLTNLKFHFCRVTLQLSYLSSVAPPLTAALTVSLFPPFDLQHYCEISWSKADTVPDRWEEYDTWKVVAQLNYVCWKFEVFHNVIKKQINPDFRFIFATRD